MEKIENITDIVDQPIADQKIEVEEVTTSETQEGTPNKSTITVVDSKQQDKVIISKPGSFVNIPEGTHEVRITTIGNVDSGKSTLIGVLTKGILDDGRGAARQLVFNYTHEKENGRTSSISHEIMGFKNGKQVKPRRTNDKKSVQWSEVIKESDKVISLIDLCGHEKYLKTTIFGLTGLFPDYAMIIVGANMGVQRMTKEHLGITVALKIPIIIVITKIDVPDKSVYKETLDVIIEMMKSPGIDKHPVIIEEGEDLVTYAKAIKSDKVTPIFSVSSVNGAGLTLLRDFISILLPRDNMLNLFKSSSDKVEYLIDSVYNVNAVGIVITGTLISGKAEKNQILYLGPDKLGEFRPVMIKSIHCNRVPVNEVESGNSACFNIKSADKKNPVPLKREHFRKGMVLVDKENINKATMEFDAEVLILHHATTIRPKYQAVVHCGNIRQSATVVTIDQEQLMNGESGNIKFKFVSFPEYLHEGVPLLFREGRTRGVGTVVKTYPMKFESKETKEPKK